jgi:DNA-binding transcriptional ArsR family regulator
MEFIIPKKPKVKLKPKPPDRRQIAVVPLRAIMDKSLSLGALRVLCMVCAYANRSGITWVGQQRLAQDLGVSRRTITAQMTKLRTKGYVDRLRKGAKESHTSTMRIVYDRDIGLDDLLAMSSEDDRSPRMILEEEREMAKKGLKTSAKAVKTLGEYVDTKIENKRNGEPIYAYNSKLESVLVLYRKIYKEEKVMNELDMKAIELAESIGLTNQEFATGLEVWLNARPERPDSIIDYARGL